MYYFTTHRNTLNTFPKCLLSFGLHWLKGEHKKLMSSPSCMSNKILTVLDMNKTIVFLDTYTRKIKRIFFIENYFFFYILSSTNTSIKSYVMWASHRSSYIRRKIVKIYTPQKLSVRFPCSVALICFLICGLFGYVGG